MQPLGEYIPGLGDEGGYSSDPITPWPAMQPQQSANRPYVPPGTPTAPPQTSAPSPQPASTAMTLAVPTAPASKTSAGVGVLLAAAATATGAYVGGAYGAGAGLLLMGATRNVLRAKKLWASPDAQAQSEAVKSGTMALFGIGIGGWLAYKAYEDRKGDSE